MPSTLPGSGAVPWSNAAELWPALTRQALERSACVQAVTAAGACGAVAVTTWLQPEADHGGHFVWLALLLCIVGGTFVLQRHWVRHAELKTRWRVARWQLASGSLLAAALWGAYAVWLWPHQRGAESLVSLAALAMVAAAGAQALAPLQAVAHAYAAMVLIPAAWGMLRGDSTQHVLTSLLAVLFYGYVAIRVRQSNRHTVSTLRLARKYARLRHNAQKDQACGDKLRRRLDAANAGLLEARSQTLQARERVLELEHLLQERERATARLAELATQDAVTRLVNRDAIVQQLESAIAAGGRPCVLFLDLDRFKEVNDAMGHFSGDVVLRQVSKRLKAALGTQGLVGRWGGDEFVVVIAEALGDAELLAIAEGLRQAVSAPLNVGGQSVRIDACVGVARHPEHGSDAQALIRSADMAVYAAKNEGRACVRSFEAALAASSQRRYEIAQALRSAKLDREFHLVFQPLTSLHDGRLHALETLLRWKNRTLGAVTPAEFIPIAEESGAIIALGRWVLERACAAAANWPGESAPIVSVNVSVVQLLRSDFPADVSAALQASGLPPNRLEIEITESVFANDAQRLEAALAALRALGVRIAIDDFGTGYSSLAYLHRLQVDAVKIDQSFVRRIDGDAGCSIVTAIVSIARSFGIACVAEGVESAEQCQKLRELGVDIGQGWYFGKPMPAGETAAEQLAPQAHELKPAQLALV
jgi:diguanylate cyclase (GGDEF)-like protein